jgi:hypothetical protein
MAAVGRSLLYCDLLPDFFNRIGHEQTLDASDLLGSDAVRHHRFPNLRIMRRNCGSRTNRAASAGVHHSI